MKIKRWPVLLAVVAALIPVTCGSGSSFDVPAPSSASVDSSSSKTALNFPEFTSLNLAKTPIVSNQGLSANQFQSVRLLTFSLTGVDGADLSIIKNIKFYVQGSGQERQMVAMVTSFEKGQVSGYLDVTDGVELAPHFKSGTISITNETTLTLPNQPVKIKAEPVFDVHVQQFPSACAR